MHTYLQVLKGDLFLKTSFSVSVQDTRGLNEVKTRYASDNQYVEDTENTDLNLKVNDHLFIEMLQMEIRGKTISYASLKKSKGNKKKDRF